jgi:hypothetical protein
MRPFRRVFRLGALEVCLCDCICDVQSADIGRIVITGAHGGSSNALYALETHASLYVFNDCGIGKDGAGIAGLKLLNEAGIAAVAVSHLSARIGEAEDTLANGVIAQCNRAAHALGLRAGQSIDEAVAMLTG